MYKQIITLNMNWKSIFNNGNRKKSHKELEILNRTLKKNEKRLFENIKEKSH